MVTEIISAILMVSGALLMLTASIGLIRMPDIYMRMHATTKTSSPGLLLILIAMGFIFTDAGVWLKALLTVIFVFLTVPIASHTISKVAHMMKIRKWENTLRDDFEQDKSKKNQK